MWEEIPMLNFDSFEYAIPKNWLVNVQKMWKSMNKGKYNAP